MELGSFMPRTGLWIGAVIIFVTHAMAQTPAASSTLPTPTTPPAAAPVAPSTSMRYKISAGDLLSAESILQVYKEKNGEDGPWLTGLSWLARGALLLGDLEKAERYASQTREKCAERIASGVGLDTNYDLQIAYGAVVEVEAQLIQRSKGDHEAAEYVRGELAKLKGPVPLLNRLNKRLDMLTLTGEQAPELVVEDFVGERPPMLQSMRGKPVVIFLWYEGCGDCKGEEAALARTKARYAPRGVQFVTLTRYYEDTTDHSHEKFLIDSVWKSVYADVGTVPMVISTASVERYGGSSTPTFIFLDRYGIIRRYTPTRLTEEELGKTLEELVR